MLLVGCFVFGGRGDVKALRCDKSSKFLIVFAPFALLSIFCPSISNIPLKVPQRIPHLSSPFTMLYLIGLGLSDETDITVKGLDIVRKASRVYLENYTAILLVDVTVLV